MQYLLKRCIEEKPWLELPDAERDAVMRDYRDWVARLERAARIPTLRVGGTMEVRPVEPRS